MVVVQQGRLDGGPDAETPLPPLQPVKRPAKNNMEGGGKGDRLKVGR